MSTKLVSKLKNFGKVLPIKPGRPLAIHRDDEVDLLQQVLSGPNCRSVILLGESGCGKTVIVQETARRLGTGENKILVLETTSGLMLTGTKYIGEWQTRVKSLCDLAKRKNKVIIYFTDIHQLMYTGRAESDDSNVGDFMTPFIERREVIVIGECSEEEYRRGVERFPSFQKLFEVLHVLPLSSDESLEVLKWCLNERTRIFQKRHGRMLRSPDTLPHQILELANSYITYRCLPGKAIVLLDQVFELLAAPGILTSEQKEINLTPDYLFESLERYSGIPALLLDDRRPLSLNATRKFFESRVLGQARAVDTVVDVITMIKAGVTNPDKPIAVLFFSGPTGVGKTELAKALAEFIFGSQDRMFRFDMSEYKDYSSYEKLIGAPHTHPNSQVVSSSLPAKVRRQPFAVILFDEIEKAHSNIFDLFLQMFDDGRLTDPTGKTASFTQTIIILTSNIGCTAHGGDGIGFHQAKQDTIDADILNSFDIVSLLLITPLC